MAGRKNLPSTGSVTIKFTPPKGLMGGVIGALSLSQYMSDFNEGVAIIYREAINRTIKRNFPDSDTLPRAYTVGQDPATGFPFVHQNPEGITSASTGRALFEYITPVQSFLQGEDTTRPIGIEAFFTEVPRKGNFQPERSTITASFAPSGASLEDVKLVPNALVKFAILPWVRSVLGATGQGAMNIAVSLAMQFAASGVKRKPIITGVFNMARIQSGEAAFFSSHSAPVEKRIKTLIDQLQRNRGRRSNVFSKGKKARKAKGSQINLDLIGVG